MIDCTEYWSIGNSGISGYLLFVRNVKKNISLTVELKLTGNGHSREILKICINESVSPFHFRLKENLRAEQIFLLIN